MFPWWWWMLLSNVRFSKTLTLLAYLFVFLLQLSYDYQFDFEDDQHKIPCNCGASNCRKWMNWVNFTSSCHGDRRGWNVWPKSGYIYTYVHKKMEIPGRLWQKHESYLILSFGCFVTLETNLKDVARQHDLVWRRITWCKCHVISSQT